MQELFTAKFTTWPDSKQRAYVISSAVRRRINQKRKTEHLDHATARIVKLIIIMVFCLALKVALRLCLIVIFIKSAVTLHITWTTVLSLSGFFLSYISPKDMLPTCFRRFLSRQHVKGSLINTVAVDTNPFKGKTGPGYLTREREVVVAQAVADSVLFDASNVTSLKNFEIIKHQTECIFAKKSRLWGSPDYDATLLLEENVRRLVPTFYKFTMVFEDLGLDGFLIELPGDLFGTDIKIFGKTVCRVLITMLEMDVARRKQTLLKNSENWSEDTINNRLRFITQALDTNLWHRRSWVFEFNRVTFFVTSFAPFYPATNSRFGFGCKNCFILFQPELSFAIHDLPPDTAVTNWTHPKTVRDKIRVAFRDAGREYEVPMKQQEPMVHDIVKKIDPHDEIIKWWLMTGSDAMREPSS